MIRELPAEAIDLHPARHLARARHLLVAVVVREENVPPVDERQIPARAPFFLRRRAKISNGLVEVPALPVLRVALGRGAVDREGHLVDPRVDEPPDLFLREGEAVRARVEIDVRKARLDVLAHLDGALVQESFAVVEEIDPAERRPRLVHAPAEQLEVEHAGVPRAGDAGLRRAAGLRAGDVTGRGALDVQPRRKLLDVQIACGWRILFAEGEFQRAIAAEFRTAGIEVAAKVRRARSGPYGRD